MKETSKEVGFEPTNFDQNHINKFDTEVIHSFIQYHASHNFK